MVDTLFSIDTKYMIVKDDVVYHNSIRGIGIMISYAPLWETLKNRNESTYTLIHKHGINPRTINRLKHDKGINTDTIEKICKILECTPNDIMQFI